MSKITDLRDNSDRRYCEKTQFNIRGLRAPETVPYLALLPSRKVIPGLDFRHSGIPAFLVSWFPGFLVSWFPGFLVSWFPGFLVSWFPGFRVSGFPGFRVSGFPAFRLLGQPSDFCTDTILLNISEIYLFGVST